MNTKTTLLLTMTLIATLNASDRDEVTMAQYQEAENLLYARTAQQSNVGSFYSFGVQKLCGLYQTCKKNGPRDSMPCAKVTLALAKAMYEQNALIDDNGGHVYPLQKKSFELFEEVTTRYPDAGDPNVWALATFYQADNAFFGCNKQRDFAQSTKLYQEVINNPAVTDNNVVAWAKGRLGDSYRDGKGVEQDPVKSVQLFQNIIDNDNTTSDKSIVAWAEFWVADAYEHGRGREKDVNKAAHLFEQITQTYAKTDPVAVIHARGRAEKLKS